MKGQVAIELVTLIGIMLIVLLIFNSFTFDLQNRNLKQNLYLDAKGVCNILSSEINTATSIGDGYRAKFILPESLIERIDYGISITPSTKTVSITWLDRETWCGITTSNVTVNNLGKGNNRIANSKGEIIIG